MKEVQSIKTLSNDIHRKSEQLPHVVARNKDLVKFQQNFKVFAASTKRSEMTPIPTRSAAAGGLGRREVINVLMMRFREWIEGILTRMSRHRHECSLYLVIYVLSQMAFSSFAYRSGDGDHGDDDEKVHERTLSDLQRIQSSALSMLKNIETKIA